MWVFTKYGFYSTVCVRDAHGRPDPHRVVIRSRLRKHLNSLLLRFPGTLRGPIEAHAGTDYAYRIYADKVDWQRVLELIVVEMDYPNFKAAVADEEYHDLLGQVWDLGRRLQIKEARSRR